jgi:hypothetical protein
MMIIDTTQDFEQFAQDCQQSDTILIPILSDHSAHPRQSNITGIYISMLNNMQNYYISVNHKESIKNFTLEEITSVIDTPNKKYVLDIKEFNHNFNLKNVHCCNSLSYYYCSKKIEQEYTRAHSKLYSMYWKKNNVNEIIPIYKHIEYCQELEVKLRIIIDSQTTEDLGYKKLHSFMSSLSKIESSGLYTTKKIEYSYYNPYTLTGRPSNTFNKINYAALNKTDGTRNKYISRFTNGGILELDYDAYHLRIIGDIIGYKLPKSSVHEYLGKQYFATDNLTEQQYLEAKQISFQLLYGGIPKEFLEIPFFNKVNDFIYKFWKEWKLKNHYKTYLYKRKVYQSTIGDMNPQKLFNYYIQSAETELNSEAMERVMVVLEEYKSKFILYTYDSFTFDFNISEGKELIIKIKNAMKYPTRISFGSNYGDLKDVSSKFS